MALSLCPQVLTAEVLGLLLAGKGDRQGVGITRTEVPFTLSNKGEKPVLIVLVPHAEPAAGVHGPRNQSGSTQMSSLCPVQGLLGGILRSTRPCTVVNPPNNSTR